MSRCGESQQGADFGARYLDTARSNRKSKNMSTCTGSIFIIMHRKQGATHSGAPTSRGTKVGKSQKGADFGDRYSDTALSNRKSRNMSTCTNSIYIIVQLEQGPRHSGAPTSRGTKVGKIVNGLKPQSSKPEPPIVIYTWMTTTKQHSQGLQHISTSVYNGNKQLHSNCHNAFNRQSNDINNS